MKGDRSQQEVTSEYVEKVVLADNNSRGSGECVEGIKSSNQRG
jgi:hypothetical protein